MTLTRTVRMSKKGQIVLPKEMREKLSIKEDDRVIMILQEDGVVLTTPELYAKSTRGIMKGTWGKTREEVEDYIKKERASWL